MSTATAPLPAPSAPLQAAAPRALPQGDTRTDSFAGVFGASIHAVRALLPTDELHPVRIAPGRAAVLVIALNNHEGSGGSYGEIGIAPFVTEHSAPPLLPLLGARPCSGGVFVSHLPVTTAVARDEGRSNWGYPSFIADMDFEQRPDGQAVRLAERGRHILSLTVAQGRIAASDQAQITTYSSHHGDLLRTRIETSGASQWSVGRRSATLDLGDHPVADALRRLELSRHAILAKNTLDLHTEQHAREIIGSARAFEGYRGQARTAGRLTVRNEPGGVRHLLHPAA